MQTLDDSGNRAILDQLLGPSQIRIALHPIVHAESSDAIGREALMRGPRGVPFESPPLAFAMAAALNMLERLDCHCIRKAIDVSGGEGSLFLNVHPRTLVRSSDFWGVVGEFERSSGRRPDSVVFEIVEHSPARETDLPNALRELRALGFRIAVDDLGEGSAGLRRLVEVAPDFAKIDRFFIQDVDTDRRRRVTVDAIARLGRELGVTIIAEGVEREEERRVLIDLGIPLVQGYLFGKPQEVSQ